jgi:HSP20 family protein
MHSNPNPASRFSAGGAAGAAASPRRGRRFAFASPLEEIRDEMDRLWSEFTSAGQAAVGPLVVGGFAPDGGRGAAAGAAGFPAVNVSETADAIVIEAELPGVIAADLDVSVAGDELVIRGRRPSREEPAETTAGERPNWLRRERGTGDFERRIELPVGVDPAKVEAKLSDGVLMLSCTKAAECQPHKIEIRS